MTRLVTFAFVICAALLSACTSKSPYSSNSGGYYKDDGPASTLPGDLDRIADATPRADLLHRFANRPYSVFGINYTPMTSLTQFQQRGVASWYGRKFHGQKTAIGETYDMFAMTAAHPTLPLPSYARITNTHNNRSVIVRINDRGPFHTGRIVDLSYAAAHRLGIVQRGSGKVRLTLLLPPFEISQTTASSTTTNSAVVTVTPVDAPPLTPESLALNSFFVQLAAFGNFANAQVFQQRMRAELGITPHIQQRNSLFRVQLGPFASHTDAEASLEETQAKLGTNSLIITTTTSQ